MEDSGVLDAENILLLSSMVVKPGSLDACMESTGMKDTAAGSGRCGWKAHSHCML